MSQQIQFRRGLDANRTGVIFEQGEPIWTTDTKGLFIGDGASYGGQAINGIIVTGYVGDGFSSGVLYKFPYNHLQIPNSAVTIYGNVITFNGEYSNHMDVKGCYNCTDWGAWTLKTGISTNLITNNSSNQTKVIFIVSGNYPTVMLSGNQAFAMAWIGNLNYTYITVRELQSTEITGFGYA